LIQDLIRKDSEIGELVFNIKELEHFIKD